MGLIYALEELAKTTSHQNIACTLSHSGGAIIPTDKATQLYWIAREAVSNAVTHANPTLIAIRMTNDGEVLELSVEDDGRGLTTANGSSGNGIGLQVMAQRAELAGGSLTTGRSDSGGTAIRCKISLHE